MTDEERERLQADQRRRNGEAIKQSAREQAPRGNGPDVEDCEPVPPDDYADVREANMGASKPSANGQKGARKESAVWVPPAVVSYGANFNAAAIPLRPWVLGHRRARGEVTIDAGPPGVNKSTLLISDSVQMVTGRTILADRVYETGEVLLLAGEDARRDVEARLAGILERFHIQAAELCGRLHVVYLAEIDPRAYTLAEMGSDVTVLNENMLGWLREWPGVIAVLIDPILAWHQLMENSNEALQVLSSALRRVAVQGNRHVGFDHHITKLAMSDPEAHVGNLAALRGASAIGAAVRWAFTIARLKADTAADFGISEPERKFYRRLDALKASYGPDDDRARLLRVESVPIANGESVGVLVEVDTERTRTEAFDRKASEAETQRSKLIGALTRMLTEKRPRSANGAAVWLIGHAPELKQIQGKDGKMLSDFTVRRYLPGLIGSGLTTTHHGVLTKIVLREQSGPGRGSEIDFEQPAKV